MWRHKKKTTTMLNKPPGRSYQKNFHLWIQVHSNKSPLLSYWIRQLPQLLKYSPRKKHKLLPRHIPAPNCKCYMHENFFWEQKLYCTLLRKIAMRVQRNNLSVNKCNFWMFTKLDLECFVWLYLNYPNCRIIIAKCKCSVLTAIRKTTSKHLTHWFKWGSITLCIW